METPTASLQPSPLQTLSRLPRPARLRLLVLVFVLGVTAVLLGVYSASLTHSALPAPPSVVRPTSSVILA